MPEREEVTVDCDEPTRDTAGPQPKRRFSVTKITALAAVSLACVWLFSGMMINRGSKEERQARAISAWAETVADADPDVVDWGANESTAGFLMSKSWHLTHKQFRYQQVQAVVRNAAIIDVVGSFSVKFFDGNMNPVGGGECNSAIADCWVQD